MKQVAARRAERARARPLEKEARGRFDREVSHGHLVALALLPVAPTPRKYPPLKYSCLHSTHPLTHQPIEYTCAHDCKPPPATSRCWRSGRRRRRFRSTRDSSLPWPRRTGPATRSTSVRPPPSFPSARPAAETPSGPGPAHLQPQPPRPQPTQTWSSNRGAGLLRRPRPFRRRPSAPARPCQRVPRGPRRGGRPGVHCRSRPPARRALAALCRPPGRRGPIDPAGLPPPLRETPPETPSSRGTTWAAPVRGFEHPTPPPPPGKSRFK